MIESFLRVFTSRIYRAIMWGEDIDLCPDALYMELTGKTFEEYFGVTDRQTANA